MEEAPSEQNGKFQASIYKMKKGADAYIVSCPLIYLSRVSQTDEEPRPAFGFAGGRGGNGDARRRERGRCRRRQLHPPPIRTREDREGKPEASGGGVGDDSANHHNQPRQRRAAEHPRHLFRGRTEKLGIREGSRTFSIYIFAVKKNRIN